jgi:fructokinase
MTKPSVFSCGEVLWDLFPDGPKLGGAPANFAGHIVLLGGRASFLTAIGDDENGHTARAILMNLGIAPQAIQVVPHAATGAVDVSFDADHRPSYRIHEDSSWDHLAWTAAVEAEVARVDAIYFGTLSQRSLETRTTIRRALAAAKARGIPRILDINLRAPFYDDVILRESLALASIVKLSDEELATVGHACGIPLAADPLPALHALRERFDLDLVAYTRGAEGAILLNAHEVHAEPGIATTVVDTVGAGDSFTAALTLGLLRRDPLPVIARHACTVAASVCAHAGALPPASTP